MRKLGRGIKKTWISPGGHRSHSARPSFFQTLWWSRSHPAGGLQRHTDKSETERGKSTGRIWTGGLSYYCSYHRRQWKHLQPLSLTNQKVSVWVVEAPGTRKCREGLIMMLDMWKCIYHVTHDGKHLHTNPYSPVNHGGVAGVDMDGNTAARFGISGTTDSMQTLQCTDAQDPDQQTETL